MPETRLYSRCQGAGPSLLIIPGGPGDADAASGMFPYLEGRFRVITFDRRGQARSPIVDGGMVEGVHTHSEDIHQMLAEITNEPVFVVGSSLGALIGMDLVLRYPEQVRVLVAHEPPSTDLLEEEEQAAAMFDRVDAERIFRDHGVMAALAKFIEFTGVRRDGREEDAPRFQPSAATKANAEFFFDFDGPAVRGYHVDIEGLRRSPVRVIPAAGSTNPDVWLHRCGVGLGKKLGHEVVYFPGGHGAFSSHPKGFAEKLIELLAGHKEQALRQTP